MLGAIVYGALIVPGYYVMKRVARYALRLRDESTSAFPVKSAAVVVGTVLSWSGVPLALFYLLGAPAWTTLLPIAGVIAWVMGFYGEVFADEEEKINARFAYTRSFRDN